MNVIRGAITIDQDTPEEIKDKTAVLLDAIKKLNGLNDENTKAIIFSLTQDIHSYYPAKAARECGYEKPALFSAVEPDITGALPLCIRVMILAEGLEKEKHVYLGKAVKLRKDLASRMNIALDGPAGSGKSTIAKELAKSYNILYLDTGAMYRACALAFHRDHVAIEDSQIARDLVASCAITVDYIDGTQHTFLNGEDVSMAIRVNEVSMLTSTVAKLSFVREKMVAAQRSIAAERSCVLDGRDIGTEVLPDAPFKFYVTASSRIRAERRLIDIKNAGADIDLDKLQAEIEERDRQDMTRAISPLKQAKDAILIDTSYLTIEQTIEEIRKKIQEKI